MPSSISAKVATSVPWRREFDFVDWSAKSLPAWLSIGKLAGVRVEWIEAGDSSTIWSDAEQLGQIVEDLLDSMVTTAFPGALIQLKASVDETKREWLTFQIRDRSGGRDEAWMVADELRIAARRLEGFVDIATESSRSTTCSLHLPTGTLQGWLRRNSDRRFVYAVDCLEGRWLGERDRTIQAELSELGSIHRLNDATYLLASKDDSPASTVSEDSIGYVVRSLGSMNAFVQRLDRATRWDASHRKPELKSSCEDTSSHEEQDRTSRRVFKEPKLIQPLRPRRVKV